MSLLGKYSWPFHLLLPFCLTFMLHITCHVGVSSHTQPHYSVCTFFQKVNMVRWSCTYRLISSLSVDFSSSLRFCLDEISLSDDAAGAAGDDIITLVPFIISLMDMFFCHIRHYIFVYIFQDKLIITLLCGGFFIQRWNVLNKLNKLDVI